MSSDYDDVLRRALHAAAESVEPSADGLERIRERLAMPPLLSLASAASWYSDAAMQVSTWARPVIGSARDGFRAVIDRFRPAAARPGHARPALGWLRPAGAVAVAIFVVAVGGFAAMELPHVMSSTSSDYSSGAHSGSGHHGGKSGLTGGGTSLATPSGSAGSPGGQPSASPAASQCSSLGSSNTSSPSVAPSSQGSTSASPPAGDSSPVTPPATSPPVSTTSPGTGSATPDPGAADTSPSASPAAAITGSVVAAQAKIARGAPGPGPCPSSSPKKKPSNTPAALGADGLDATIAGHQATEHGAAPRGESVLALGT